MEGKFVELFWSAIVTREAAVLVALSRLRGVFVICGTLKPVDIDNISNPLRRQRSLHSHLRICLFIFQNNNI